MAEGTPAPARAHRRLSLRDQVLGLLAISVLLVLLGTGVVIASFSSFATNRARLLDGLAPARLALTDVVLALDDQETGLRGYALTRNTTFLEPYEKGRQARVEALERLRNDLDASEVAGASEQLQVVQQRIDDWVTQSAEPALVSIRAVDGRAQQPAVLEDGKRRFDAIRDAAATLDATLTSTETVASATLESSYRRLLNTLVVELGVYLLVLVLIAVVAFRSVLRPLSSLGEQTKLVVDGDLDREINITGPPELETMGEDVDRMRRQLVRQLAEVEAARFTLEQQAAELERSNADLEQFAYVASHDLQEPLRKISGFCQLLEKRYGGQLDERADEYIYYAVDGAHRMQALINDLLTFSRVGRTTDRFERVDLGEVVAQAQRGLSDGIQETGAHIEVGALPEIDGDERLLTAVFHNLLSNALKFRGEAPPEISISGTVDSTGSEVDVVVQDNGIGIEPEYADQIFVIFKRLHTRSEYDGTGIGLALAKKIVEFHGGRLWLEPTDGAGARFHVVLPQHAAEDALAGPPPVPAELARVDP